MKPRILFYGYFGMGNVGDEAICEVLLQESRHQPKKCDVVIASNNPQRSVKLHGVNACSNRLLSASFMRNFLKTRTLIFAGGGRYGSKTLRLMSLLTVLAKLLGKRVEYRAVGLYPYNWCGTITLYPKKYSGVLTKFMLKVALACTDYVSVRDEYSKRYIEGDIIGRRALIEFDPALRLIPNVYSAKNILKRLGLDVKDTIIGLNIRFLRDNVFIKTLHAIIKALDAYLSLNNHVKVLFIPFGYGSTPDRFFDDDISIGYLIRRYLSNNACSNFYILNSELKPSTILGLFKFLKVAIGFRYHAIMFAHICRVPVLGIAYDTKIIEFAKLMRKLNYGIRGLIVEPSRVSSRLILNFLRAYVR